MGDIYPWTGSDDPAYVAYMETEWGVPCHDDRRLFELLSMDAFQAGLSWGTILKKRANFRRAFANWNLSKISKFGEADVERLLADAGIIRHRGKIEAVIANARAALGVRKEFGSLDAYFWGFVHGTPIRPARPYKSWNEVPGQGPIADTVAKDLKKRGFRFIGPTACYAFLQAIGIVDDRPRMI